MFRIGPSLWMGDRELEDLIGYFLRHPGIVDELSFFTHGTHAPLQLEDLRGRFERLKPLMDRVRSELGVRAGINVLATMGHHEENLGRSLNEPWQRVLDPDGRECKGCYCPADPEFQVYVRSLYDMTARSAPDFIWVDDDVRLMGHMPIGPTCFCDRCVSNFSDQVGERFDRKALVQALGEGDKLELRRRWLEHNREMLSKLFKIVEETVHGVSPGLPLGFMTGDRFFEGYPFERLARDLAGDGKSEVRWRPGGGFYWDDELMGLVGKAHDVGRQVSALPDSVEVIQSEIENFPYQILKKSIRTTMLESVAHMAAGATGLAFNVLTMNPEPLDEFRPFIESILRARPFFDELGGLGRTPTVGIFPAWNADLFVANGSSGSWFEGRSVHRDLQRQYVLSEIGLPICYGSAGARATTLSGSTARAFSREELIDLLGGGLYLDAEALHFLEEQGLGELTGVRSGEEIENDAIERLTDDPLNGAYSGRQRDCRQSFWHDPAHVLVPLGDETRVLSEIIDYGNEYLGACMSAFENELGGRVAVSGYSPWFMVHNLSKTEQIKSVFWWLSRESLPAVVESYAKIVVWARGLENPSLILINASLDTVESPRIRVVAQSTDFEVTGMDGQTLEVKAEPVHGSKVKRLVLEHLDPWSARLIRPL